MNGWPIPRVKLQGTPDQNSLAPCRHGCTSVVPSLAPQWKDVETNAHAHADQQPGYFTFVVFLATPSAFGLPTTSRKVGAKPELAATTPTPCQARLRRQTWHRPIGHAPTLCRDHTRAEDGCTSSTERAQEHEEDGQWHTYASASSLEQEAKPTSARLRRSPLIAILDPH